MDVLSPGVMRMSLMVTVVRFCNALAIRVGKVPEVVKDQSHWIQRLIPVSLCGWSQVQTASLDF